MSSELIARLREGVVDTGSDANASKEAADEIERLEIQVARYQGALEKIKDQTFQQANSPRLIDQLWHFVRWTKSVAREALEGTGAKEDETDSEREQI